MTTESLKERIERCEAQVHERPTSAAAHFNLGLAYTQHGYMDRAEREYRKAVELDPELVEGWVNLGGALLLKWDFEAALEANLEAVRLRDDIALAHYNLGQSYLYKGDAEGLVRANHRVLELDPDNAAGHYFLAVGLLALDRVGEARAELAAAMALGHRPSPEFLKKLHQAESGLEQSNANTDSTGTGVPETLKEV
ncbi:MAG: tetratricopeptide repeat protein [Acidobacteria bacterium]|jgi:tetratricopeptide (TPR) repeat protein|nr:tetratricopeptide repeat protein [Acidobacteriota bacterium]